MPSHLFNLPNPGIGPLLETQIGILAELTRASLEHTQRLNQLNLELARDLAEIYYNGARQLVTATDPAQLPGLLARQLEPLGQRMRSHAQALGNLVSNAQLDFTRAGEHFMPEAARAAQMFAAGAPFQARAGGNGAA